jgi:hypothetical protein
VVPSTPLVDRGPATCPSTSYGFLLQYLPICLPMPQRFTALLLRLREHGVVFFLDMRQDGVHQRTEARITRHVFRLTGPQCRDQLPDSVVFLTRFLPQCFPLLRCLLGKGRGKHRFFQQRIEFQRDTHLGGNLLFQVRITCVFIGLEEFPDPLMISFQRRNGISGSSRV